MEVDKQLRRKITQRWHILAGVQREGQSAAAFAQLEYILTEAGLLARTRKKRHEFGKIAPDPVARDEKYQSARYDLENNE